MNEFQSDYALLAAASRAEANAAQLHNVCLKHLRSAEAWERLAEAANDLKFVAPKATLPKLYGG